jgi:hypothetical protein
VEAVSQKKRAGLSSLLQSRYIVGGMVSDTVSLAEVVTARGGRRLSEDEGWALLCASVQVYSRRYGVGHCEPGRGGDCTWWKASLRG